MEHLRRLKKVINWLIFKEIAENERALLWLKLWDIQSLLSLRLLRVKYLFPRSL